MDLIKQLTGKNPREYESVASHIINDADTELFKQLVAKDDFLFDFIKENVSKRLERACNKTNYKNLLNFLDIYSPYYEEFISSTLAQYADELTIITMKDLLKTGTPSQKAYAAKFFSYVCTEEVKDLLNEYAFSDFLPLQTNVAKDLSIIGDKRTYDESRQKLNSRDEFEVMSAVRFLSAFNDETVLPELFNAVKHSSLAENIASEIFYMKSPLTFINTELKEDMLYAICGIINGLAEIIPLSVVTDFELYELFNRLIKMSPSGASAITLGLAKEKFLQLSENDEYVFDEDKNTKNEINDIKTLLISADISEFNSFIYEELYDESDFVLYALDLVTNKELIEPLLESENQTVVLKAAEVLKSSGNLSSNNKSLALEHITDENIKSIISAL